jgi:transcription initiation factor TFIID subunit 8
VPLARQLEPPKKAALPSLQKKLKTASLVQGSLKNLLVKTTPVAKDQFTELLGQAVNYEANIFPRKRWKVSKPGNSEEALESSIGV